jgi:CubicO group peptidase (beta-lactamase class C family)
MEALDGFSGAVLVTRGGSTLVRAAAGMADVQAGVGCTPDTRFQIASVSKQFTAAAVMLLVESGVLSLGEPITAWLPDIPAHWRHVTLHQLLTHTSGLGHWRDVPGFDDSRPGTSAEFLAQFAAVPLHSAPGSAWRYSSPGFLLAALIVQQASGQRYLIHDPVRRCARPMRPSLPGGPQRTC